MTIGLGIGLGITIGGNGVGGSGGPPALQTLTLSSSTFTQGTTAGTVVGTIGNKTSGSQIEIRSASGRVVPDATYANLVVGLTAAAVGTFGITLREIHPTLGTKDTPFTITVSALTALSPMSASQAPWGMYSFQKVNAAYAGNCMQIRDSSTSGGGLRTIGFSGNNFDTSGFPGAGDGITYTVPTWYDQSGNARNLTSTARPMLFFPGNFATLTVAPAIGSGGTGYSLNDVLTPTGGLIADSGGQTCQVTVSGVSGGVITAVTVSRAGKYKHSPSPTFNNTGVTGGTGTGATFNWVLTPDVGNTYTQPPYIDFTAAALHLVTSDTSLNVGGTANLAILLVGARFGYGNAYTTRPGSPSTSSNAIFVGYGTSANNVLIGAVPQAATNSGSQTDPVSFSKVKDSLGRSASVYGQPEWMSVDESAPAVGAGLTNYWFNQTGATVTAGGDTRKHWSNRLHAITSATSQRLVVGATGALSASCNGAIREVLVFNPATPLSDTEVHRMAIDQNTRHSLATATTWAPRIKAIWTGQSYAVSQLSDAASGNGSAGTAAAERRWKAKLAGYLGINSERISYGYPSRTCVGGTAILKRPMPGDPASLTYWWDEDTNSFGNLATGLLLGGAPAITNPGSGYTVGDILTWVGGTLSPGGVAAQSIVTSVSGGAITGMDVKTVGNYTVAPTSPNSATGGTGTGATLTATFAGGLVPYLDAVMLSFQYSQAIIIHSQGQQDSTGNMDDARINTWSTQTYQFVDAVRNYIGQPNAPVVSEILARYDGNAAQNARVNTMTRRQYAYYPTQKNMFVSSDSGHLARAVAATFGAHLGSMSDFDSTTGTAEDGYQRSSWQDAKASAAAIRMVYGLDIASNDDWRGPILTAAAQSGSNTIDVTVSYPYGCVGTDISTVSGTYGGFRAFTSGGDLTISSVSKVSATKMRVTLSASVPAGTSVVYEPNYASGLQGVSVRNQLVDNNPDLNLPVSSSQILAVT